MDPAVAGRVGGAEKQQRSGGSKGFS